MDELTLRWILGLLGGWCFVLSGGVLTLIVKLAKIETILSMESRIASRKLHSPTDHLGLDTLLEKHFNGTIGVGEWHELKAACEQIVAGSYRIPATLDEQDLARKIITDPKNGVRKT